MLNDVTDVYSIMLHISKVKDKHVKKILESGAILLIKGEPPFSYMAPLLLQIKNSHIFTILL